MAMLIDMHNHTRPASDDSVLDVEELVRLAQERGLDGVAVTDHDYFWNTRKLTPLGDEELIALGQRYGVLVVPAVEINTDDGHLICFGLREYIFGMHHTHRVRELLDQQDGAMILAHPYRRQMAPEETMRTGFQRSVERARQRGIWHMVDAVEVMNGRGWPDENAFAQSLARELGLKGVASSDAHRPSDVAKCATLFYDDIENVQDLIAMLRAGRFEPVRLDGPIPPEAKEAISAGRFEPVAANGYAPRDISDLAKVL